MWNNARVLLDNRNNGRKTGERKTKRLAVVYETDGVGYIGKEYKKGEREVEHCIIRLLMNAQYTD